MASNPLGDALARFAAAVARAAGRGGVSGSGGGFLRVTITDDSAENAKGLDRLFDALGATIRDVPAVMESTLLPAVREAHGRNFDTEGATGRGKWAALAPRTLAERQRLRFGPGPILTRTGALRGHVLGTPAIITRHGDTVELRIEPDVSVEGVPKYRALALGLAARNLPGRPMVTIGPAAATSVTSAFMRGLRARAQQNGLR